MAFAGLDADFQRFITASGVTAEEFNALSAPERIAIRRDFQTSNQGSPVKRQTEREERGEREEREEKRKE